MTEITSEQLHEQTVAMLDRSGNGQPLKIMHNGKAAALLIPPQEDSDPSWAEIMAKVRSVRAQGGPTRPDPILAERKQRNYAARVH